MAQRQLYRVKYKERGIGPNGGDGPTKSFRTHANSQGDAQGKCKTHNVRIISVKVCRD